MATPVQAVNEPEYGAKVTQENNEASLAAAQPAPGVPMPEVPATEPVAQEAPVAQAAQQYVTIKNPYMLLPASLNFPQQQGKTPVEQNYDVGLLWRVLADSPASDDSIKTIASRLLGGE
jgi:hypothetical protein